MYLVPLIEEIEQIMVGKKHYNAAKIPHLSNHNVQLHKCFFDNGVIKTL